MQRVDHAVTTLPSFLAELSGHHGARKKKAPHVYHAMLF
jgi:hypothetical protein